MHRHTFYIILGSGLFMIILTILCCKGLFTSYARMNFERMIEYNKKFLKKKTYTQNIEKNIFQTWHTKNIPDEFKSIVKFLRLQNPEYKYHIYDNDDIEHFIKKYYPEYWESYNMIDPQYGAARADFFRYMVVYHYGGVYFDIKSGASRPLRKIIKSKDTFVCSGWGEIGHPEKYINWAIIAKKGHPILRHMLDDIDNAIKNYDVDEDGVGGWGVLKLTGPIRYSDIIDKYKHKYKIREYSSLSKSKLVYNYTFKMNADVVNCAIFNGTKGMIGNCNHSGSKKKYGELGIPIVKK